MAENKSIFDTDEFSRDENLPLEDLLAGLKTEDAKVESSTKTEPVEEKEEELSPLEQMKRDKAKEQHGIKVSNKELEEGIDGPKKSFALNDERMKEFEEAITEMDETIKKRNCVVVLIQPKNQFEYIDLVGEINSIEFDENGTPYFNLKDDEGNLIEPIYCRLRKEDEEAFDYSVLSEYEQKMIDNKKNQENGEEVTEDEEETISDEKKKIVEVLIDKTGFGTDFAFTEEEKEKIAEAEVIKVNEVKLIDIEAIKAKRSTKSFQEAIQAYNIKGPRTTICFPSSGFKAQMKGLTDGEYADISLSMDNVTFDQYYKRLSIIYNKMTNISTGPFKDFEDFLKRFAYTDIPLAIYAMFVATEQENQQITLRCGNEACKKSFDYAYTTRSILRLDRCADTFLKKMEEIATSPASKYDELKANSAVENSKIIVLPESGFAVEIGVASAYDFLYNFIPLMDENTFREAFGDDMAETFATNMFLLTTIRSVMIPIEDGFSDPATGYKDILDAVYAVSPSDRKILFAYANKIQSEYEVSFSFENVQCPHCHNITKHLDLSIDDLVFQRYQRLMSTEVDLSQIQGF